MEETTMKVTEHFMRFYEDVLLGKVTLEKAQVLFCGGEDKNRWYNLKSRLKDEVKALEKKFGKTEKEISKWTEMNYTMSNLFLYVYEKILTGELSVKEGQEFIGNGNSAKWYNLKAKEKAGVEALERKYKKTLKYGKVVELATEPKKGDIRMNKSTGIKVAAAQGRTEKKEQGKKPRKVVNEAPIFKGNCKEIAGYPSVKAYFVAIYEDVLKGVITEEDGRLRFEGTKGNKAKWNNYKYVTAAKEVKELKERYGIAGKKGKKENKEMTSTKSPSNTPKNTPTIEDNDGDDKPIPPSSSKASKGISKRSGTTAPKMATNKGSKKGVKNLKEDKVREIESKPNKEKETKQPKVLGDSTSAGKPAIHIEESKVKMGKNPKAAKPMLGYPSIKDCFLHLVEEVEMGTKTLEEARKEFEGVEGISAKWDTYKYKFKVEIDRIRNNVHTKKEGAEMSPSDVPSDTLFGMKITGEVIKVDEKAKQEALQKLGVMNIQSFAVDESVILPSQTEVDIKELRAKLLKELNEGNITREKMVIEGQFENIEELNVWLKRKQGQGTIVTEDAVDTRELENSAVHNKDSMIINPNIIKNEPEELVEDYEEDYEDYSSYDEDDKAAMGKEKVRLEETVIENKVIEDRSKPNTEDYITDNARQSVIQLGENLHKLMEEVRAEKKEEHSDKCPYNCVNGKVFLASRGYVPCPHCMGIEKKIQMLDEGNDVNIYKLLKIPRQYRQITSVPDDVLKGLHDKIYVNSSLMEVKNLLNTMVQSVRHSSVASISTYVHVSNYVDIRPFIYGLQREAVNNGVGTVPYISLNTLAALLYASNAAADGDVDIDMKLKTERLALGNIAYTTNAFRRLAVDFPCDYYDYCKAPMVILEATAETMSRGWSALADLLAERAREGLPTYVFGYYASTAPNIYKDLKWLVGENMSRLDMLTVVELKKANKAGEAYAVRSFNSIEDVEGDTGAGIRVVSMIENEPELDVRKARDVFIGKYGN